jgi:putative methyltransferase (TIGR04325 family)
VDPTSPMHYIDGMANGPRPTFVGVAHKLAQRWLPPVATQALKNVLGPVRWSGDFANWEAALRECEGYSAEVILERVTAGALEVKEGRALYERDSRAFYEKAYEWPLLSCLLWAANREDGELNVLDFGGSLGSRYYQHRKWLAGLKRVRWSIVEQENFARVGREKFQDDTLRFYTEADTCIAAEKPNVLYFSASLQYLEKPYAVLSGLLDHPFQVVILDRMPLVNGPRDRITVQRVGERIYPASYPAWFFSKAELLKVFEGRFRLVEDFDVPDRANLAGTKFQGFLFERIPR